MDWLEQGCPACRGAWERGSPQPALELVGTSYELHTRLYRCRACHLTWEELERHAHQISEAEAQALIEDDSFERALGYDNRPDQDRHS